MDGYLQRLQVYRAGGFSAADTWVLESSLTPGVAVSAEDVALQLGGRANLTASAMAEQRATLTLSEHGGALRRRP